MFPIKTVLVSAFLPVWLALAPALATQDLLPPVAPQRPFELVTHGHTRIDEYYWMRERENPEVISWLTAENAYTQAQMEPTLPLQKKLADELRNRIPQDDDSLPRPLRGYDWFERTRDGLQYPVFIRRKSGDPDAAEEVVVDVNQLAEGHGFCSVGGFAVATSGNLVAWAVDRVGRRKYTIEFRDMATGRMLADRIPDTTGNLVWAEDNQTLFYCRQDPGTLRSDRVFAHRLGTAPETDRLVYTELDEEFSVGVGKSRSRQFILIQSVQTLSTETRLVNAYHPELEPEVFLPREENHEYDIDHLGGRFVIRSNWEAANFRLLECPSAGLEKSAWRELVPHSPGALIEGFELFDNWLVLQLLEKGLTRIRFREWNADSFRDLDFGEPCYEAGLAVTEQTDTSRLRFDFSSLRTPDSTFEFDLATGTKTLLKADRILGGFDRENYVSERLWATAGDGTQVPVSLVRHVRTPVDGTAPCLLYGYGSYGSSESAGFDPSILNLLDRGFVYAIAHIRGGSEMGRHWYEDGKLMKKKNTFTDFIDCGRFLIERKYADPKRLYANGGSAGGLLMGAVANMAPDLWHGIIAEVAFVDVVTTGLDASIPLTTSEYDEWGDPNQREYYDYMLSYSPYDNVEAKNYPNLLVTTGLHDSQVQYWEPAKWVARLRDRKTDRNLLLLHTEMEAGHGGASGRYDQYREAALRQAFLLRLAGISQ